jgi:hypothetical protein
MQPLAPQLIVFAALNKKENKLPTSPDKKYKMTNLHHPKKASSIDPHIIKDIVFMAI